MKARKRLTKGILIALAALLMLNFSARFNAPAQNPLAISAVYAQEQPADGGTAEPDANVQPKQDQAISADVKRDMVKKATAMAAWSHTLFSPLINFFAFNIGNFLGIDYIFEGGMGKMLREIWVISRNLVNISFVFILLWMALKEIFDISGESALKKNMLKFVLLLVAVNFSWLATKVVLDASNVVTNVVFSIPSGIETPPEYGQCTVNTEDASKAPKGTCYPTVIIAPANSGDERPFYYEDTGDQCKAQQEAYAKAYDKDGKAIPLTNESDKAQYGKYQGRTTICVENLNLTKYDMNTSVVFLTYGMARIQNLVYAMGGNGNVIDLTVGVLLSLILQIAYTVSLLALFIALVIRMGMLWLFVAFSPFMVLVIWFNEKGDQEIGGMKFGFTSFLKWAFVPVKVGAIFAVSFIMISAGQSAGILKEDLFASSGSGSGMVFKILEWQSLFMGIGSMQNFIWLLMTIVVLWLGVFGVLSDLEIVKVVTEKINSYGKDMAKLVGTAPYWAPVLPLGKGGSKVPIKELVGGVDMRKRLETLSGKEKEADEIRKMRAQSRSVDLSTYYRQIDMNQFNHASANKPAQAYGFDNAQHMMRLKPEDLRAALRDSKNNISGREDALLEMIKKYSSPKSNEELRIEAERTAAAQKAAGVGVNPTTPAGPAAAPPAAPKPPASGGGH